MKGKGMTNNKKGNSTKYYTKVFAVSQISFLTTTTPQASNAREIERQ